MPLSFIYTTLAKTLGFTAIKASLEAVHTQTILVDRVFPDRLEGVVVEKLHFHLIN